MYGRCCCGCCSLSTGTSIALIIAAVEAVFGIFFNAEILQLISEDENFNPLAFVINIDTVDDVDVFHGIVWAGLGLNAFWIASAIFAITGNVYNSHGRLTPWIFLTYLLSMFQFGTSVYFAIKFQSAFAESEVFFKDSLPSKTLTYLTLLCLYSGGGILILFNEPLMTSLKNSEFYLYGQMLSLLLSHVVERRGKEIDHDYSALILYLFSHMSRCPQMNDGMQQSLLPPAPPSYDTSCPPYLPPEIYQRANDSSGSSWSLSTEAFKADASTNVVDINSIRRQVITQEQLASVMCTENTQGYQRAIVNTNNYSALPY